MPAPQKDNRYTLVITGDGSSSLRSDEYNETMHSISGAYEEALLKHVYPSRILECGQKDLHVLDIGFGIGYNVLSLIREFIKIRNGRFLNIVSLERDFSFFSHMKSIRFGDERDGLYSILKTAFKTGMAETGEFRIELIKGDARVSVRRLSEKTFNAVFHDPYSPSKNPELWSVDFFRVIRRLISGSGILTTYSSASQIRAALLMAGFRIGAGPSVGGKREGTLASVEDVIPQMGERYRLDLLKDRKAVPYRDEGLDSARKDILERRIYEMSLKTTADRQALQ